jgi:hypothetical protein
MILFHRRFENKECKYGISWTNDIRTKICIILVFPFFIIYKKRYVEPTTLNLISSWVVYCFLIRFRINRENSFFYRYGLWTNSIGNIKIIEIWEKRKNIKNVIHMIKDIG